MAPLSLLAHAELDARTLARIEAVVLGHHTLGDVARWDLTRTPPRGVADVVVQDEYTHDILIEFEDGVFLAYDTT